MTRIVAIGECMVEMAPSEPAGNYRLGFAGDTMNTAWYLRQRLPATDTVDYLSAVGQDDLSGRMLGFLAQAGIGIKHIARREKQTVGLYMITLQNGERSFSYWRNQSAARTLAQEKTAMSQALAGAEIAYFSGITLAILPADDRQRLLDTLNDFRLSGGKVVFDPNLRPRLWEQTEQMTTSVMTAAAISDVVLPSHEDEATWFGDADPAATAQRYAQRGANTVIVKNGPEPILAYDNGELSWHDTVAVNEVVDTTAAGDSFNAGFLAAQLGGSNLTHSINAAARLAAHVVQSRGALVSGGT